MGDSFQQQKKQNVHRPDQQVVRVSRPELQLNPAGLELTARQSGLPAMTNNRAMRQASVLQLQRTRGNRFVQQAIGQGAPARIQREDGQAGSQAAASQQQPPLQPTTVPIPDRQRQAIDRATQSQQSGQPQAAGQAGQTQPAGQAGQAQPAQQTPQAQPPAVPEEARVPAPVSFNFQALPPQIQIRFLEEFNFTATVTAARLAWQHRQLQLTLGYEYGGPLSLGARAQTGAGTFSGSAAYDPGSQQGTFGAGWSRDRWRANLSATTSGQVGAGLQYGAQLPPFATDSRFGPPAPGMFPDLARSIPAGEQAGRNLLTLVPQILADAGAAPDLISQHSGDISAVSTAARDVGRVVDLTSRPTRRIDWGFYLRFSAAPGSGVTATAGAGLVF